MHVRVFTQLFRSQLLRFKAIVIACVASLTLAAGVAEAGFITSGTLYVEGTGVTGTGKDDPSRLTRGSYYESDSSLNESDTLSSYQAEVAPFSRNSYGLAPMISFAAIRSGNGEIGAAATAGRFGGALSNIFWNDTFQLLPPPGGSPLPIDSLIFRFNLHGSLATTANDGGVSSAAFIADVNGYRIEDAIMSRSKVLVEGTIEETVYSNEALSKNISTSIVRNIGLTEGRGEIAYAIQVESHSFRGSATSDFSNTLKPAAITFADGSTPESHGYTIVFGSGMSSPNVSAVPEPGSLALLGIGIAGLSIGARRRRRGGVDQAT